MKFIKKSGLSFLLSFTIQISFYQLLIAAPTMLINDFRSPFYNEDGMLLAEVSGKEASIINNKQTKINHALINLYENSNIVSTIYSPSCSIENFSYEKQNDILIYSDNEILIKYNKLMVYGKGYAINMSDQSIQLFNDSLILLHSRLNPLSELDNMVNNLKKVKLLNLESENYYLKGDVLDFNRTKNYLILKGHAFAKVSNQTLRAEQITYNLENINKIIFEPNVYVEINNLVGNDDKTDIRSNKAILDYKDNKIEFQGNIKIRNNTGAINCNKMHLKMSNNKKLDWLIMQSNVIFQIDSFLASGNKIFYSSDNNTIKLEGSPKIKKDKNIITANAINYSFLNKKLSCEPNAKMIISSDNDYWKNLKKELIEF